MSLYRNAIWFLNGIHQYTRKGYEKASRDFEPHDLDVSVVGRSFMVTGANSGIGRATALAIATKGGRVHMVCRNKEKAEEVQADIIEKSGNTEVYVHILDLSETRKVFLFAEAFKKQYPSLHVLINNAGCMIHQRQVNEEGLENNFAINTMGGMLVQKLRVDDLQWEMEPFDGLMVYAQNKRQQVVLTEQWAKSHPLIHFSVMHPGWADTPAVSTSMPQFHQMMDERLRTVEQGADTVVWLALSRSASRTCTGQFFQDRKPVPTHLPLAWTHSSAEDIEIFMVQMENLAKAVQSRAETELSGPLSPYRPQLI
ncbi:dehydrogenase/reductase SDR family member 12-like isoform X2 [Synchiropus splendidus]|uniref:dehydrogenase/reductase SDR family member 12-like isoform X2 n=1 Tax=Synchiropus splendidus TaxID=270530 RepID=UPI00237E3212|nr:dehydrogenase/reductase SDR family member 12-like isoform X2 [Synchiropus splendidus]